MVYHFVHTTDYQCHYSFSFIQDWWTCHDFASFYRKWNLLVHDWIKAYIYSDLKDVRQKDLNFKKGIVNLLNASFIVVF